MRIRVAAGVEGDAERFLQEPDRFLRLAEQEVEGAEVVRQLADVNPVESSSYAARARSA